MNPAELAGSLRGKFPDLLFARDEVTVVVQPERLLETVGYLRDQPDLSFGFFADVTATDWPGRDPRFWLAYELYSMEFKHRVRVKIGLPEDDPAAPSLTGFFPAANWPEREVFDFYGIRFDGHPDLRRIFMPDDWEGHPLRKTESLGGVDTRFKGGAVIPPVDQRTT